jgi:hypothetical protein
MAHLGPPLPPSLGGSQEVMPHKAGKNFYFYRRSKFMKKFVTPHFIKLPSRSCHRQCEIISQHPPSQLSMKQERE